MFTILLFALAATLRSPRQLALADTNAIDHLSNDLFTINRIPVPVSVAKRRLAVLNDAI